MDTVTLAKTKYDLLKRRASLHETVLRALPRKKWGIEMYTAQRIREFAKRDELDQKTAARVKKILRAS